MNRSLKARPVRIRFVGDVIRLGRVSTIMLSMFDEMPKRHTNVASHPCMGRYVFEKLQKGPFGSAAGAWLATVTAAACVVVLLLLLLMLLASTNRYSSAAPAVLLLLS